VAEIAGHAHEIVLKEAQYDGQASDGEHVVDTPIVRAE
jgi:hypothetical protein